jgi:hypothetical protein
VPAQSKERVVPTSHVFLIFELDGYTRHTYDNDSLKENASYSKAWISGVHRNFISISAHENSEMLVVQFKPFGSFPFLHAATDLFNELVIPAHEVLSDSIYELREQMTSAADTEVVFELVEAWPLNRFDESMAHGKPLLETVTSLQDKPVHGLNALMEAYTGCQKKLIDEFKKFIGLTPKYYQRILRFNDLMQKIQHKDSVTWRDIAQDCGFSDKSHLIKEFRHFSGINPEQFISNEFHKTEPNFFPLNAYQAHGRN